MVQQKKFFVAIRDASFAPSNESIMSKKSDFWVILTESADGENGCISLVIMCLLLRVPELLPRSPAAVEGMRIEAQLVGE